MITKIKPVLVLSIICTLVCALLRVTYNLTYVDTSGIITEKLGAALVKLDGDKEFVLITDRQAAGLSDEKHENIVKIVKNKTDNTFLFEVVSNGYEADGIDCVISLDAKGAVKGIEILALQETPGLGTKINDPQFLEKFVGVSSPVTISKNPPEGDNEVQAITGSTRSSRGLGNAVNAALAAYQDLNKEVQA